VARSVNAADSRMVNLFPEVVPDGGKEPAFLQRCPGLRLVATVGDGPIRGMWKFGDFLYVASGGKLYRADGNFAVTELGLINGSGPVSMSDNGTQLFVACNPDAFIYNSSTGVFAQITDVDFPGAVTVGYLDGYFVFNEPDSQRFWVTSLNDGTQVDPLDFASAEGNPDNIVSLMVDHREVWLFGNNTIEVWYNAGAADFPLERIQGAFMETGCLAPYSVAKLDNSVFWLGSDARGNGIVYRNNGYNAQRVSTHAVEWQIQQYNVLNDAIGYSYQQDGHSFYVLTFPTANATWVFDVATGAWHERAYWDGVQYRRHRSNCQANYAGQVLVGDWENGRIYVFDPDVYDDNKNVQRWLRSWRALPTGQNNLKRTAHHILQLDCESGAIKNQTLTNQTAPFQSTNGWTTNSSDTTLSVSSGILLLEDAAANQSSIYADFVVQTTPGVPIQVQFRFIIDPDNAANSNGGVRIGSVANGGNYLDFSVFADPSVPVDSGNQSFSITPITTETHITFRNATFKLFGPTADMQILQLVAYENTFFNIDPRVMLRWSDDGGHTWSNEHWASMGKLGEYGKRVIWRRLGMTTKLRDRVYEISGTDPVKIAIMGAELTATPTSA
jgi:hypothetical protein